MVFSHETEEMLESLEMLNAHFMTITLGRYEEIEVHD